MKTAVIPTRNDNYGMFLAERAMQCLNCMVQVFDEVILVDWNSPHGVSMFDQIKNYIEPTGKIRSIVVEKDFVSKVVPPDAQPCCEVLARNVGIRRANGDWIVSCNVDNIPTQFSTDQFNPKTMYTTAKWNIPETVHLTALLQMSPADKMKALVENKHRFEKMEMIKKYDPADNYSIVIGCGDFQAAHRDVWEQIRGFEESLVYRCFSDSNVQAKTANIQDHSIALSNVEWFHLEHKNNPYFWAKDNATRRNSKENAFSTFLKTQNKDTWGFSDVQFREDVY